MCTVREKIRTNFQLSLGVVLLLVATGPLGCGKKYSSVIKDSGVTGDASTVGVDADVETDGQVGLCGDGILDPGEQCDDGNQSDDDECLRTCVWACGDGVVNAVELCDTGITAPNPGACPADCDDNNACTSDTLVGADCQAECIHGAITACTNGDGCCPSTCNATTDTDCSATCGNGVLETGETCDPPGTCPTDCDDSNDCTDDVLSGAPATCDAVCSNTPISACTDGDNCCPNGCNATTDTDCSASCGNGIVETGETCDPPGTCPTTCDDSIDCTLDQMTGNSATCNVACSNTPIVVCVDSDGCCAPGCNTNNDTDCSPVCGNGVPEPGEGCDDGNLIDGDGCDSSCQPEVLPTAFRMNDLELMDPHIFADTGWPFYCEDVTNSTPFGIGEHINETLHNAVTTDTDGDGFLDLSFLAIFRPQDQSVPHTGVMDIADADCTAPMGTTVCDVVSATALYPTTFTNQNAGTCLDAIPNNGYTPAIQTPGPVCFYSTSILLTVSMGGIQIPLEDVQIGATYNGNPASDMVNGLMRGFISETDADAIILPATIDVVGGLPLSSLMKGGSGCCQSGDDRAQHNGEWGWWFYFNFPAAIVTYIGP